MKKVFWVVVIVLVGVFLLSFLSTLSLIYSSGEDFELVDSNVGVIEILGPITDAMPVLEQIETYRDNDQLKALVVRLDTPGGAIGASQEIFLELKKLSEESDRPLVMTMGNVCASGGLYISLGAPKVFALPGTITGSMGVIVPLTNMSRLAKRLYLDPMAIKSGRLKDAGNPLKPLDNVAKDFLQAMVDTAFVQFQNDVKTVREMTDEEIKFLSDGRVVDGVKALELGIVHEIGTFTDAVDSVAEDAEIKDVKLAYLSRKPKSIVEKIIQSAMTPLGESFEAAVIHWMEPQSQYPVLQ